MTWFPLAFCSALLSAVAAIMQKRVLSRMHALEFAFIVSLVMLVPSLFLPLAAHTPAVPASVAVLMVVKSLVSGLAFLFVMLSLEHNEISSALPLLGLTPAITALLALLVLGEPLGGWEWVGIGLMGAGTYILERKVSGKEGGWKARVRGRLYVTCALVLFAVSSVADKMLVSGFRIEPLVVLFYQQVTYSVLFGGLLLVGGTSIAVLKQQGKEQLPLIAAIALATILYRLAQLEATRLAPVALVLAVKRTSILFATVVGGRLFTEERLGMKLAGAILIVGAGFLILRAAG